MNLYEIIPGYRDAVEREQSGRDSAFVVETETLCGVEVLPFTARHYLLLDGCDSAFITGGLPTHADVARALWVVSNGFRPGDTRARDKFLRSIRKLSYGPAAVAIREYIDAALADSPAESGEGSPGYVSWVTHYVDLLACEYHWSEREILNLPLRRLFQYVRRIQKRHNPHAIFIDQSDNVRAEWLRKQNPEN